MKEDGQRDSRRVKVECLCGCGKRWFATESRMSQKYYSAACVSRSRKLPEEKVKRWAQEGFSRSKVAEKLEIPYSTLVRKLITSGLNNEFLGRGKYHSTEYFIINRGEEFLLQHQF